MIDNQFYKSQNGISSPAHRVNAYYSGHIGSVDINFNNDIYFSKEKQFQFINGNSEMHGEQNATTNNRLGNTLVASDLKFRYQKGNSIFEAGTTYNYIHRTNDYNSEGGIQLVDCQKIKENKWALYANYQLSLENGNLMLDYVMNCINTIIIKTISILMSKVKYIRMFIQAFQYLVL